MLVHVMNKKMLMTASKNRVWVRSIVVNHYPLVADLKQHTDRDIGVRGKNRKGASRCWRQ